MPLGLHCLRWIPNGTQIERTTTLHEQQGAVMSQVLQEMREYAPFPYDSHSALLDRDYTVNVSSFLNSMLRGTGVYAPYADVYPVEYRLRKLSNTYNTRDQYIVHILTKTSALSVCRPKTHYRLVSITPNYLAHGVLMLLGKHRLLAAVLQHMSQQVNAMDTLGHRMTIQNAHEVLTLYIAEAGCDLAAHEPWDETIPWSWREPLLAQQVAHQLRNPQRLRDIYRDGLLTAQQYTVYPNQSAMYESMSRSALRIV